MVKPPFSAKCEPALAENYYFLKLLFMLFSSFGCHLLEGSGYLNSGKEGVYCTVVVMRWWRWWTSALTDLVFMWVVLQHALRHVIGHKSVAAQSCHMSPGNGHHLQDEALHEAAHTATLSHTQKDTFKHYTPQWSRWELDMILTVWKTWRNKYMFHNLK